MTKQFFVGASALSAVLIAMPIFARVQDNVVGKQEYLNHCAVCHGQHAKGNGALAAQQHGLA